MKKQYIKPDTVVVEIKQVCQTLTVSEPQQITSNAFEEEILSDEGIEEEDIIIR